MAVVGVRAWLHNMDTWAGQRAKGLIVVLSGLL